MKLTHGETADICRDLATLLHAGIGAADGVFLLAQEESGQRQALLKSLGQRIDGGATLAEAIEESGAFPGCVAGMVHMGEQTGRLEEVLVSLAQFYEGRSRSIRRIRHVLTYPALLMALMVLVIGVLLVQVLPVFDEVYASLGSRLTGVARMLLQLGRWIKGALPVLFVLLAAVTAAALAYAFAPPVRARVNAFFSARFGDRGVAAKYNNANFARALSMGLGSALPPEEAVELSGRLLADIPAAAGRFGRCAEALRSGVPLPEAMAEANFLPPAECRILAIGLRQGSGDQQMAEIADRLMEQADEALESAVSKIEPAMVLICSLLVGAILLCVMLPLMNIMAAIG